MLTDAAIKRRAKTERSIFDSQGLYLRIEPGGSKGWRWNYSYGGRRKTLSFGPYPFITLEKARELRDEARRAMREGKDPLKLRREARAAQAGDSVKFVADQWLEKKHHDSAPATKEKYRWLLEQKIYPTIGTRSIRSIDAADLLQVVRPIERAGQRETAHRVLQVCGRVWRFAVARNLATRDPSADLREALAPVRRQHYPAVTDPAAVGALLRAIDSLPETSAVGIALRLLPHVFVRPGELRTAEWIEFDLDAAVWRVPARKTKLRRDHLVPLSTQAVALLRTRQAQNTLGSRYVFATPRTIKRPLSENAFNAALRALGYPPEVATAHGFRSTARTLLDERLRLPPEWIEVQLAHLVPGLLGETYNRARYVDERAGMMQRWSDYLDELKAAVR